MTTTEGQYDAVAHCVLAVEAVVVLHRSSIPARELHAITASKRAKDRINAYRTLTGYTVDMDTKCSQRILDMAGFVKINKRVALDLLKGHGVDDFARSPRGYAIRKDTNQKGNKKKGDILTAEGNARKQASLAMDKAEDASDEDAVGEEIEKETAEEESMVQEATEDDLTGGSRTNDVVEEEEGNESESAKTSTKPSQKTKRGTKRKIVETKEDKSPEAPVPTKRKRKNAR